VIELVLLPLHEGAHTTTTAATVELGAAVGVGAVLAVTGWLGLLGLWAVLVVAREP
jgi:hypothetical protein